MNEVVDVLLILLYYTALNIYHIIHSGVVLQLPGNIFFNVFAFSYEQNQYVVLIFPCKKIILLLRNANLDITSLLHKQLCNICKHYMNVLCGTYKLKIFFRKTLLN